MAASEFSPCEQSLLDAFGRGEAWSPAYHRAWAERSNIDLGSVAEAIGRDGRAANTVDAETIRKALAGEIQNERGETFFLTSRGAAIKEGARIVGRLDLTALRFDLPIEFEQCVFDDVIVLNDAHLGRVSLRGSAFPVLIAENARIGGVLNLSELPERAGDRKSAPKVLGAYLRNARIDGDVLLNASHINPERQPLAIALGLAGARIEGDLDLSGARVHGETNLLGARISGKVIASGAALKANQDEDGATIGWALSGNGAHVGQSVFLRQGFSAEGEVNFIAAIVGGDIDCSGGAFASGTDKDGLPAGEALDCARAKIGSSVFLAQGFDCAGRADFSGAEIGGPLFCDGGSFTARPDAAGAKDALTADAARIGGDVSLGPGFEAKGAVNLRGASIGGQLNCTGGRFAASRDAADRAVGPALTLEAAEVGAQLMVRSGFEADGPVSARGAQIHGDVLCSNGAFRTGDPESVALSFNGARIDGVLYLTRLADFRGRLDLRDARTGALADDEGKDPAAAPEEIYMDGFCYDRFTDDLSDEGCALDHKTRIGWLDKQPDNDLRRNFKPQPWTQCAQTLRRMGHLRDARLVLNRRERAWIASRRRAGRIAPLEYAVRSVLGATAGHGYKTQYAVFWSLAIWAIGWLVFALADDAQLMRPTGEPVFAAAAVSPDLGYEPLSPAVYSLDVFLPVFDFHQERYWLPLSGAEIEGPVDLAESAPWIADAATWGFAPRGVGEAANAVVTPVMTPVATGLSRLFSAGWLKAWFWFQIAAGWVLATITLAGLTGFLERDRN